MKLILDACRDSKKAAQLDHFLALWQLVNSVSLTVPEGLKGMPGTIQESDPSINSILEEIKEDIGTDTNTTKIETHSAWIAKKRRLKGRIQATIVKRKVQKLAIKELPDEVYIDITDRVYNALGPWYGALLARLQNGQQFCVSPSRQLRLWWQVLASSAYLPPIAQQSDAKSLKRTADFPNTNLEKRPRQDQVRDSEVSTGSEASPMMRIQSEAVKPPITWFALASTVNGLGKWTEPQPCIKTSEYHPLVRPISTNGQYENQVWCIDQVKVEGSKDTMLVYQWKGAACIAGFFGDFKGLLMLGGCSYYNFEIDRLRCPDLTNAVKASNHYKQEVELDEESASALGFLVFPRNSKTKGPCCLLLCHVPTDRAPVA